METLKRQYLRLLKFTSTNIVRDLYNSISWNTRLVGIKGSRGVGKTTMLLQRIKLAFPDPAKAIYVSLDDIWFGSHTMLDLAELADSEGITHLFIDEVHRLRGWERQIKNIYDYYPALSIVFTGSSLLEIDNSIADLSRRCLLYNMQGLSFREFLSFQGIKYDAVDLSEILYNHINIASQISEEIDVMSLFRKYLAHGFYPFYVNETEADYLIRVNNMIASVIDYDIPAVENVEYNTLLKAKHLLSIIATQTPSSLNAKQTAEMLDVTVNQMMKILSLLDRSQIIRLLYYKNERSPKSLAKPQKVIFDNPSIINALGFANLGKIRESFFASMLSHSHSVTYPMEGDLMIDSRYLFEVGGARKGFTQIKDIPDSFVAADNLAVGFGNRIPLWLFGFLY